MATVRRPDLEGFQISMPDYIGLQIAPVQIQEGLVGEFYFQDIEADVSADTDRTAGTAIDSSYLAEDSKAFSITPYERRQKAEDFKVPMMGGLAKAEMKMARLARRAVQDEHEADVAAAVLAQSSPGGEADILDSLIKAIEDGKATIEDYGAMGSLALVGSRKVIQRIKRYDEVIERMQFTGVIADNVRDVRNIGDQQLAAAIGVDTILAGKNSLWYTASATYHERLALVILPNPQQDADEEIQFARTAMYPLGTAAGLQCQSYFDDDLTSYVVQARLYFQLLEFNPELVYLLKGVDEDNAITTTTTTS